MKNDTRDNILNKSKMLFALNGYEGFSMRLLAQESATGASSIYHFFNDKDELLKELFEKTRKELGQKRLRLKEQQTASEMLRQRIVFQFKNIEDVIFILKYYIHFRQDFLKHDSGFIPPKAYLHIEEVLRFGIKSEEFNINEKDVIKEAKTITHAINGFLIEYYPKPPKNTELDDVVDTIHGFVMRSLTNKEVGMA